MIDEDDLVGQQNEDQIDDNTNTEEESNDFNYEGDLDGSQNADWVDDNTEY